jgi:AAA domain
MAGPEEYLTDAEQEAFNRIVETFGPDLEIGPFEPKLTAVEAADEVLAEDDAGFRLRPIDLVALIADGVPETEYLDPPYLPRTFRVWAFGEAESSKTLFFQWTAAKLTRAGMKVLFISAENPLATDVHRLARLHPDIGNLATTATCQGLDLDNPEHFVELLSRALDRDLVVVDTLSACWSGDEQSNADVVKLDREVLARLIRLTGATVVIVHHTGHPQAFVNRGGVGAGRGASAMGQKADGVLVFKSAGPHEFTIEHAKDRSPGGRKEPKAKYRVVDTEDGGLDIERIGKAIDERVIEAMDAAVEVVEESDGALGTNALTEGLKGQGFGGSTIDRALKELRAEEPARIRQIDGEVVGGDGKRRKGRPWVSA